MKIFISYRRTDSEVIAGRIYDWLVQAFGRDNIFMDIDNIPPGEDFRDVIDRFLDETDVMLVLIGPGWIDAVDDRGNRRLELQDDWVRTEVERGLRVSHVKVILVMVLGGNMPPADTMPASLYDLSFKHAVDIHHGANFTLDMGHLIEYLKSLQHQHIDQPTPLPCQGLLPTVPPDNESLAESQVQPSVKINPRTLWRIEAVGIVVLLIIVVLLSGVVNRDDGNGSENMSQAGNTVLVTPFVTEAPDPLAVAEDIPTSTTTFTPTVTLAVRAQRNATNTANLQTHKPTQTDAPSVTNMLMPTLGPQTVALQLAQLGVTRNADWEPYVQEFDGVRMVLVPVGCFMMGSDDYEDEQPIHEQCFDAPFWIDETEVTNEQFGGASSISACRQYSSDPNQPRNCVSWFDARDYCAARGARLPTEREWEYVARGSDGLIYPWGDEFVAASTVYRDNSNTRAAIVGSRPNGASWVGALDMAGNVWEWTSTIYDTDDFPYPYDVSDERDEVSSADVQYRTVRGGSFVNPMANLRGSNRGRDNPDNVYFDDGFRCVRSS